MPYLTESLTYRWIRCLVTYGKEDSEKQLRLCIGLFALGSFALRYKLGILSHAKSRSREIVNQIFMSSWNLSVVFLPSGKAFELCTNTWWLRYMTISHIIASNWTEIQMVSVILKNKAQMLSRDLHLLFCPIISWCDQSFGVLSLSILFGVK